MNINKKSFNKFIALASVTLLFFIGLIVIISVNKNEKEAETVELIDAREVGYGFIYYNGDLYYKHKNLAIIDKSLVGESIGKTEVHLKYPLTDDTKFEDTDELTAFAVYEGTDVYTYDDRDDVLLIESEYSLFGYYVYIKDKTVSDLVERVSINHYKDWPCKIVSYGPEEIPIDFRLSDFEQTEAALTIFPSTDIKDGAMTYYVLIEDDGLYSTFEGLGNVLSDYIALTSLENGTQTYFIHKYDGLSKVLVNMYKGLFGFQEVDENTETTEETVTTTEESIEFPDNDSPAALNPLPND